MSGEREFEKIKETEVLEILESALVNQEFRDSIPNCASVDAREDTSLPIRTKCWQELTSRDFRDIHCISDCDEASQVFYLGVLMRISVTEEIFCFDCFSYIMRESNRIPLQPIEKRNKLVREKFTLHQKSALKAFCRYALQNCDADQRSYWKNLLAM